MANKQLIYDLTLDELERTIIQWGEQAYRAKQIWQGLYKKLWNDPASFTALPASLRLRLAEHYEFKSLEPAVIKDSTDGETRKILFHLKDEKAIEAVLMRYESRRTLCISTQSGCAMNCVFCATGQMGFRRNLSSGEIIEQVLFYARQLASEGESVTNVVVMGMGEPFHNYDATLQAIDRLNQADGFGLGARRFTISTVGLVPAIQRFTQERRQINLAISLHAADDDLRNSLLPINRKYPLSELLKACQEYVEHTHRRISFEWALIQGTNDSIEQVRKLAELLQVFRHDGSTLCHVNVIQLNPTRGYSGKASATPQANLFKTELESHGIPCTIRIRRGIDINAGCGQLAEANPQ